MAFARAWVPTRDPRIREAGNRAVIYRAIYVKLPCRPKATARPASNTHNTGKRAGFIPRNLSRQYSTIRKSLKTSLDHLNLSARLTSTTNGYPLNNSHVTKSKDTSSEKTIPRSTVEKIEAKQQEIKGRFNALLTSAAATLIISLIATFILIKTTDNVQNDTLVEYTLETYSQLGIPTILIGTLVSLVIATAFRERAVNSANRSQKTPITDDSVIADLLQTICAIMVIFYSVFNGSNIGILFATLENSENIYKIVIAIITHTALLTLSIALCCLSSSIPQLSDARILISHKEGKKALASLTNYGQAETGQSSKSSETEQRPEYANNTKEERHQIILIAAVIGGLASGLLLTLLALHYLALSSERLSWEITIFPILGKSIGLMITLIGMISLYNIILLRTYFTQKKSNSEDMSDGIQSYSVVVPRRSIGQYIAPTIRILRYGPGNASERTATMASGLSLGIASIAIILRPFVITLEVGDKMSIGLGFLTTIVLLSIYVTFCTLLSQFSTIQSPPRIDKNRGRDITPAILPPLMRLFLYGRDLDDIVDQPLYLLSTDNTE